MEGTCETTTECGATDNSESPNEATPAQVLRSSTSKDAQGSVASDDAISSTTPDKFTENAASSSTENFLKMEESSLSTDVEADFFSGDDLRLSSISASKCNENVEDIVQDLENLLGESNDDSFFSINRSSKFCGEFSSAEINSSNISEDNLLNEMLVNSSRNDEDNKDLITAMSESSSNQENISETKIVEQASDLCEQIGSSEEAIITEPNKEESVAIIRSEEELVLSVPSEKPNIANPTEEAVVSAPSTGEEIVSTMTEEFVAPTPIDTMVVSTRIEEAVVSTPMEEMDVSTPNEEATASIPFEEMDVLTPNEETGEAAVSIPVEEMDVSTPIVEYLASTPAEEAAVSNPIEEAVVLTPSQEADILNLPEETAVSIPNEEAIVSIPVDEAIVSTPVEKAIVPTPDEKAVVLTPDEEVIVSIPVGEATVSSLAEEAIVLAPVEEAVISTPAKDAVESTLFEKIVGSKPAEQPIASTTMDEAIILAPTEKVVALASVKEVGESTLFEKVTGSKSAEEPIVSTPIVDETVVLVPTEKVVSLTLAEEAVISTPAKEAIMPTPAEVAIVSTLAEEAAISTLVENVIESKTVEEAISSIPNQEADASTPAEEESIVSTLTEEAVQTKLTEELVETTLNESIVAVVSSEIYDSADVPIEDADDIADVALEEDSGTGLDKESLPLLEDATDFVDEFESGEVSQEAAAAAEQLNIVDSNPFQELRITNLQGGVEDIDEAVSNFERSFEDASMQGTEEINPDQIADDLCDSSILQMNFDSQPSESMEESGISPSNIVDSVVSFPEASSLEPDESMEIDTLILAAQESLARNKELPLISSTIDEEAGSLNIEENLPSLDVLPDVQSTDDLLMETNSNPTFEGISDCFDIEMKGYCEEANSNTSEKLTTEVENPTSSSQVIGPLTVEVEEGEEQKQKIKDGNESKNQRKKSDSTAEVTGSSSEQDQSSSETTESNRAPLIMTIAKHKSNNTHSILKIYDPEEPQSNQVEEQPGIPKLIIKSHSEQQQQHSHTEEPTVPKITIKPIVNRNEPHSPRKTIKSTDAPEKPNSPRITFKPIAKPDTPVSPIKLTIKPYPKLEDRQNSPKLTIKPIPKPLEEATTTHSEMIHHSPKITIKPIVKPLEHDDGKSSPRLTIKPIVKPIDEPQQSEDLSTVTQAPFKLNIKPIVKPTSGGGESLSPKITIKPVQKPPDIEQHSISNLVDFEDQIKQERIVLKINKNTPKRGREKSPSDAEKLKKIKLKLSKEDGVARIVPSRRGTKRQLAINESNRQSNKRLFMEGSSSDASDSLPDLTITRISSSGEGTASKGGDGELAMGSSSASKSSDDVSVSQAILSDEKLDPLSAIPVFEISLQSGTDASTTVPVIPPTPKKRGRPRKVPLVAREDFKDPKDMEKALPKPKIKPKPPPSNRPKRSCREGTSSVRLTLGIRPRKPRGPSTRGGRGGKRNVGERVVEPIVETPPPTRKNKERKSNGKQKSFKELPIKEEPIESKDVEFKPVPAPPVAELTNRDVSIYEEETRMSADNSNSRAQTPAKQVLAVAASAETFDESQSSIQSNATTESGERPQKSQRKSTRSEIPLEPEGEVISADKLAEYSWGGGGPYMLQEQVAQFLGIKSFKRKYPGIQRRAVDMQERDFIRESCLASEAMCDMGLTAVKSEEILDIMYSDFQHKYEEYCKHQRDRQAKDVSNKQKALSLAASQEKNKINIVEEAVVSAYLWNIKFNESRKEDRKACMDLQTYTVHYPKNKVKQVNKLPPPGSYPISLVPGQFTDYYKAYTPEELLKLPMNTVNHNKINFNHDTEDSQSDDSGSDSDSSSSDSDSSCSDSSDAENCKKCISRAPVGPITGKRGAARGKGGGD